MSSILSQVLHKVLAYAGQDNFKAELELAKQKFFNPVGIPGENGTTTESELANFIEWFVFEWPLPGEVKIYEKYLKEESKSLDAIELEFLKSFESQNYSIFQIKKFKPPTAKIRELVSKQKYREVYGLPPALQAGDFILGRLLNVNDQYFFSEALLYLPRNLAKYLERRAKMVRTGKLERGNFLEELKVIAVKSARYPRMRLEELYK